MTAPQSPRVTQGDLDAAQALCASGWTHAIEAFARHREAAEADMETRFWSIVDPNSVPSDMWEALDRLAQAYRERAASKAREAALVEALHLAASRFQVASVDAIRAGETRLSADCIAWANDCTRAALTKEPDA